MRMMSAVAWIVMTLVLGGSGRVLAATPEATMEMQAWPGVPECEPCIPLQFGLLEMRLPLSEIGRILILGSELSGVHLFLKDNDVRQSVLLGSISHERLVGQFEAAGLLRPGSNISNEAFFDRLGKPVLASDPFWKLRRIEGLDRAKRYVKASRGRLHAYSIQSDPPNATSVTIVIDGETTVYRLMGNVTPAVYELVLSNMRVAPIP